MANKLEKICYDQSLKIQFLISLNKRQVLDLDTVINFVENKNKNNKNITSNVMKTSFKLAKDFKMNAVWLTYDQAISLIVENTRNVFVIDNFKSDIFDLLRKNSNNLVYGPECIYFCKSNLLLPIKNFPVLNLFMWNSDICLDDKLENKLEYFVGLVNLMGGTICKKLRPSTTHLISKDFFSGKAKNARLYGIPIMTEEWVKKCWDLSLHQTSYVEEDKKLIKDNRLPVFHKIFVTVSQIEYETKAEIQKLVTMNGGKFSGELNDEYVTHLVLRDPKGQKYEHAKNKVNIKIVTPEWIYDSVKSGYPLIEDKYSFKKTGLTQKFDFSQQLDFSQLSQFSILSSQQDKTKLSRNLSQISVTFCSENSQSSKNGDLNSINDQKESLQKKSAFSMLTSSSQNKQKNLSIEDKFKKLVENLKPNNIFDGCDFYLIDDLQPHVKIILKKSISLQSGVVSFNLRKSVTHVLINSQLADSKLKELDKKIAESDLSVNKVDLQWVYDCLEANKQLPIINVVSSSQKSQSQSYISQPKFASSTLSIKSNFPTSSTQINSSLSKNKIFGIQSTREKIFSQGEDNIDDYFSKELNSISKSNKFEPINEKPLKGCVLTFSLYGDKIKEELKKIAANLGAHIQDSFSKKDKPSLFYKKNTHLICDEPSGTKFFKSKEWGVFCCTQEWLKKCEEHNKRLDEKNFSPESKNLFEESNKKILKSNIENIRNHIGFSSVPYNSQVNLFIDSGNSPSVISESSQETQKTIPNVNSTNEVSIQSKLENLKSMMSSNNLNKNNEQDNSIFSNLNHKIDILNTNSSLIKNKQLDHSIPIAWNDFQSNRNSLEGNITSSLPDEFRNDISIKNNQYHNDSYYAKSINDSSIVVRDNLNKQSNKSFEIYQDTMSVKTDSILKISFNYTIEENLEKSISRKLESLNIRVIKNEDDFSHLVMNEKKVLKNEAFFISLSSGKYFVHKSFVEKILKTGIVPNSEEYEWSNREISKLFSKDDMHLIKAYKYWKNKLEKTGKMAFENLELILISPKAKLYVNIIQASGGKIMSIALNEKTPEAYQCALKEVIKKFNEKEYINIDYILIDITEKDLKDYERLGKNSNSTSIHDLIFTLDKMNINCYYINFIRDYLLDPENLKYSNYKILKFSETKTLKRTRNEEIDELTYTKIAKTN